MSMAAKILRLSVNKNNGYYKQFSLFFVSHKYTKYILAWVS